MQLQADILCDITNDIYHLATRASHFVCLIDHVQWITHFFRLKKAAGYTVQSNVSIAADVSDVKGW